MARQNTNLRIVVEAPTAELLDMALECVSRCRRGYEGFPDRPRPTERYGLRFTTASKRGPAERVIVVWGSRDGIMRARAYDYTEADNG